MKQKMRIGEFAEQAGVTPRTIRYYEDLGLLGPNQREGQGFRYFTEAELGRLKKIEALKQLGLSLEEIGEVLPLYSRLSASDQDRVFKPGKERRLVLAKYQPRDGDDLTEWGRTALPVAVDLSILELDNSTLVP